MTKRKEEMKQKKKKHKQTKNLRERYEQNSMYKMTKMERGTEQAVTIRMLGKEKRVRVMYLG